MYVVDPETFFAKDVAEGADVEFAELGKETVDVKVKKAGKGMKITDEAILSAYGNPVDEIAKQLLMGIAGKVDNDCVDIFRGEKQDGSAIEEDAKITPKRTPPAGKQEVFFVRVDIHSNIWFIQFIC
jgi:N4-gp56 family major capsid protein